MTQAQLDQALAMQDAKGLALGECLLLIGACPPERVLDALKLQGRLRAGFATEDASEAPTEMPRTRQVKAKFHVTADIFLGEVLLGAEVISNDDLERAMHMHYLEGVRVGEALVRIGALTPEALQDGIALQRSLQGMAQKTARPAPGFEAGPPE